MFEPTVDGRINKIPNSGLSNIYRGMVLKHSKERVETFTAYSFIDLLSASGGIVSGLVACFAPIAGLFSKISF